MLAQDGAVGKATREVGRFALGAFDVITVLAKTTDVPVKVAETVGEEFLEVVEFTSGAVTKVSTAVAQAVKFELNHTQQQRSREGEAWV